MTAPGRPLFVVKIGGSLLGSPRLKGLVKVVTTARSARIVVVPGGGLFADAVRQAQALAGFDDLLAHRLALDAMDHLGEILAAGAPRLVAGASIADFAAIHAAGGTPLWSTAEIRSGHPDIPASWAMTSDSLSLWLAATIGADRLVLVKSLDVATQDRDALAAAGILDEGFSAMAARFAGEILLVGPSSDTAFAGLLAPAAEHAA
jgi:aspartokinase-like uncharacterized kinase